MKDYIIRDNKVLVGDLDHEDYWREPRDEEKLDLLMEMIIDLHLKFNRLKDI
jgi:hypothetical protein